MKRERSIAALLGALLLSTSCGAQDSALARYPSDTPCYSTSECNLGFVCENFNCIPAQADTPDQLDVEITPPLSSSYVSTQKLDVTVSNAQFLEFQLPKPSDHRVVVYDDKFVPPRAIDVRITFNGTPRIAGEETDLATEIRTASPRTSNVRLLEGLYGVSITRLDGAPSLRTNFEVRAPTGRQEDKEFHFKVGRKIRGEVTSSVSQQTKLQGIEVTAFSTTNGLASTSSITSRYGRFEIELPNTDDTSFRLVATRPYDGDQETNPPTWSYEEIVTVPLNGDRTKDIPLEPTSPLIQGTALVQFGASTPNGFLPLVGANITLTASTSGGASTRSFRARGATNNEGYLEIHDREGRRELALLKGQYFAEITPPTDSIIARREKVAIDLTSVAPDVITERQFILETRTQVSGQVRSMEGRAVTFAEVKLIPIDNSGVAFRTTTDGAGSFLIWLDTGNYVLVIEPTVPTDHGEEVPISARAVEITEPEDQNLGVVGVPASVQVRGRIIGGIDLLGVPNAKVEMFQTVMGKTVSLGETYTELDGTYLITLPR